MEAENGLEIPYERLSEDTLAQLIEAFILREGTDYGAVEISLERKIEQVKRQLERREIKIVFDQTTETCSLVSARRPEKPSS